MKMKMAKMQLKAMELAQKVFLSQEPGTRWNLGYGGPVHYRTVIMRSHEG